MPSFALELVTPFGRFYRDFASSVSFMTTEGAIEVMAGHEPLVVAVEPCVLAAVGPSGAWTASIGEGFARVKGDSVTILVDSAELPEAIDVERARAALQRARERIGADSAAWIRAQSRKAVARAIARLKAAGAGRGREPGG